jgi:hypothetical protein
MAGRPSGEALDPELSGPVAQDLIEVDHRGRVLLSPRIISEIHWLNNSPKGDLQALAILDRPKTVRLLSFDEAGAAVLSRRRQLIGMIDTDRTSLEELVLLEDRYHRVKIPQDRRLTLSNLLIAHLEVKPGETFLYVERVAEEVRLLSPEGRMRRISSADQQLSGLP